MKHALAAVFFAVFMPGLAFAETATADIVQRTEYTPPRA